MWIGYAKQYSSHLFGSGIKYHFVLVTSEKAALEEVRVAVEEGKIRPIIQERIPLKEAARAHHIIEDGHVVGKLVLVVNEELK